MLCRLDFIKIFCEIYVRVTGRNGYAKCACQSEGVGVGGMVAAAAAVL